MFTSTHTCIYATCVFTCVLTYLPIYLLTYIHIYIHTCEQKRMHASAHLLGTCRPNDSWRPPLTHRQSFVGLCKSLYSDNRPDPH